MHYSLSEPQDLWCINQVVPVMHYYPSPSLVSNASNASLTHFALVMHYLLSEPQDLWCITQVIPVMHYYPVPPLVSNALLASSRAVSL